MGNGVSCKSMIDIRFQDPVTGTCLNMTFWTKLLTDSWCSISKSVNQISNHGFIGLLEFVNSTDKSESVANFRFASEFEIFEQLSFFILKISKNEVLIFYVLFSAFSIMLFFVPIVMVESEEKHNSDFGFLIIIFRRNNFERKSIPQLVDFFSKYFCL